MTGYDQGPVWPPPPTPGPTNQPLLPDVYAFKPLLTLRTVIVTMSVPTLAVELAQRISRGHSFHIYTISLVIGFCLSTLSEIVDIGWLYRAYKDIRAVAVEPARFHPAWAALSIVIPVINVVLPILVFNDLWKSTEPWPRPKLPRAPALITIWWSLNMTSSLLAWMMLIAAPNNRLPVPLWMLIGFVICRTTSKALTIIVINAVSKRMHQRHDGLVQSLSGAAGVQAWP